MPFLRSLILTASVSLLAFSSTASADPPAQHTIFWISIDGLRPDYLERAETPFFDRLRAEGASSNEASPIFPSLTFSSHVSQATGVKPETHGIPGNTFYDSHTREIYRYPGNAALLEAEPIWITASRQGIRSAVLDWPLSHSQAGPVTSDYFAENFESGVPSEERLTRVLDLWDNDRGEAPLQLILGYISSPDGEGHRHGPGALEITTAVEQVDDILSRAFNRAHTIWKNSDPRPDDRLFIILTSDHGMSRVNTLIHPGHLTGLENHKDVLIITSGNVAQIHLDRIQSPSKRQALIDRTLARLSGFDYVRAFPREKIPESWGLRHPSRTGEIFLVLDKGHTFSRSPVAIAQPADEAGGPLGMHGYHPAENSEMLTPLFIFRTPDPLGGTRLGKVDSLQMHATVCRILGIHPNPEAVQEGIEWEPAGGN